jgi:hypothetical protein
MLLLCVVVALPATFLIVGCAGGGPQGQGGHEDHTTHHHRANVKLDLHPKHKSGVSGTAFFEETSDGVVVKLDLRNLPKPRGSPANTTGPVTSTEGPVTSTAPALRLSTRSRR